MEQPYVTMKILETIQECYRGMLVKKNQEAMKGVKSRPRRRGL